MCDAYNKNGALPVHHQYLPYMNEPQTRDQDKELVKEALQDPQKYSAVVARFVSPLSRYVVRLAGLGPDDVQDVLQEVFIKVYRNLNSYNPEMPLSSWVYRIAHNEAITHLRKVAARPAVSIDSEAGEVIAATLKSDLDLASDADAKIVAERIQDVVATLPDKYREVIVLRYFEDNDYQEISDILKKPPGTVATLLSRAKERLKKSVSESVVLRSA
jgi:RNA polymerase sigma-70 factor (ECF subfamily)